ncbi:MAG: 7-carboxy-7-deazaguanine synthase QueE [Armatimonadota bacterium]
MSLPDDRTGHEAVEQAADGAEPGSAETERDLAQELLAEELQERRRAEYEAIRKAIAAERAAEREFLAGLHSSARAPVHEIFTSIQGEGLLVGLQQIFIRMRGCDLGCPWCDTPQAQNADSEEDCWAQSRPGVRGWTIPNPVSVGDVVDAVRRILKANEPDAIHSVSVTGGEPLLYPQFVAALCGALREFELPIMLESNGLRPADLQQVLRAIDWVAADFKLDSALGRRLDGEARREFLRLAQHKRAFVKIVVTDQTSEEELSEVFALIGGIDPACPVFIQPVTPVGEFRPPRGVDLMRYRALALRHLRDVRIIPQIHRLLGLP